MDHRRTFADQLELLKIAYPVSETGRARQIAIASILTAYREIPLKHDWTHLRRVCLINLQEPYSTGTVDIADGIATLSGGVWPSWSGNGTLLLGRDRFQAIERQSATELRLDPNQLPDDSSDNSYTLSLGRYDLPADFGQLNRIYRQSGAAQLKIVGESEWPNVSSYWVEPGTPLMALVAGHRGGQLQLEIYPHALTSELLRVYYRAFGRPLTLTTPYKEGTVSISGRTVTGTGTVFPATSEGMILRLGGTAVGPTGKFGDNPYVAAHAVLRRVSDTELILAEDADDFTDVKYTLDDPIDIDPNSMEEFFDRKCEALFERNSKMKDKDGYPSMRGSEKAALEAERRAREMDHRPQNVDVDVHHDHFWPIPNL